VRGGFGSEVRLTPECGGLDHIAPPRAYMPSERTSVVTLDLKRYCSYETDVILTYRYRRERRCHIPPVHKEALAF
jgi:hypothetical protein